MTTQKYKPKYKRIDENGKKYELVEDFSMAKPSLFSRLQIENEHGRLVNGVLRIYKGFQWDGASGLAVDNETAIISSLPHDFFYEHLRKTDLGFKYKWKTKAMADKLLRIMMIESSTHNKLAPSLRGYYFQAAASLRGYYFQAAVSIFGWGHL